MIDWRICVFMSALGLSATAYAGTLGAQCPKKVQKLVDLLEHISTDNRVGISKSITAAQKAWKCAPDTGSPNFIAKGDCHESWGRLMSNGGAAHLTNRDLPPTVMKALDPAAKSELGDTAHKALNDVWYEWRKRTENETHHFVGRFCARIGDDYPAAKAFLKNSAAMKKDGKTVNPVVGAFAPSYKKMAELYGSNKVSNFIGLLASVEEGKCDVNVGAVTGFIASRERKDEYSGGKPVGGRFNFFVDLKYDAAHSTEDYATFYSGWRRSLLTDDYNPMIWASMQSWLRHAIGAKPLINWKNWDVRRQAEVRVTWGADFKTYTWETTRHYQVMRLKKFPEVTKEIPVGEWHDVGSLHHNHFRLFVYDRTASRFDENNEENELIKGQIERINDLDQKCPESLKSVDIALESLKKYSAQSKEGKDPFAVPGTRFGEAKE